MQKLIDGRQKLIVIHGTLNSGKTVIFNLLRKEDNFICIDITSDHFDIYKNELFNTIGEKNFNRIKEYIKSREIFRTEIFLREIGILMKEFPNHHFAVKPGAHGWAVFRHERREWWRDMGKQYTPIKKIEDVYNIFVFRHPKIAWATTYFNKINMDYFIKEWLEIPNGKMIDILKFYEVVKVENIKDNKLLREVITKTDLNNLSSYTKFDLQVKLKNDYSNIGNDLKIIENSLNDLMEYLHYDKEDKNTELFLNDELSEEDMKIDWSVV